MRIIFGILFALSLACSLTAKNINIYRKTAVEKSAIAVRDTRNVEEQIKYYVYTRQNKNQPQQVEPQVESVIRNFYNPLKPTTISLHGFGGSKDAAENQIIVSTKLEQEDCNVIVVDWGEAVGDVYSEAVTVVPSIGETIANFVIMLHKHFAVQPEQFHLVGFSLGGQIAGFTGQIVYKKLGVKVQRITGLDPAGEIYEDATDADEHLSADDANFVDVIHTNAGGYGYRAQCGHADFYPNGGETQPDCSPNDFACSHIRAFELVEEMWSRENDFVATKCATAEDMSLDSCTWVNVKMGQNLLNTGLYYLETNGIYPYAKGSFVFTFL